MTIFAPTFDGLAIYFLLATALSFLLFILPKFLAPKKFLPEKLSAYECGFEPFIAPKEVFESHFIVVAVLFIIFDLEMLFLFPWAATLGITGVGSFDAMLVFLTILTIGLFHEWFRGALTWPIFFSFKRKFFY